jgi:hypothetical protein
MPPPARVLGRKTNTSYCFFGHDNVEGARPTNCLDVEKSIRADFDDYKAAATLEKIREIASAIDGKNGAYCAKGRERSAFAVFSALYVHEGMTKEEAREAVVAALKEVQGQKAADQLDGRFNMAGWYYTLPKTHAGV